MPERCDPREDAAACDFLAMLERDRAAGAVRALAEYQARFPGFEARVAQEWSALDTPPPGNGEPAQTLGRYRIVRELGRGGQAVVYLAHDPELDRTVALKVLVSEPGWLSDVRRERLQREASALARLDHPGICAIYEARLDGATPFLAMRYVAGETLAARLRRARERPDPRPTTLLGALPDSPPRIERVLALVEEIARALHAAHTTGVVHRDIKPGNVILTADDRPVLLDFGLARTDDDDTQTITRSGEIFGSVAYMAPERLAGGRSGASGVDHRSDVYSLGIVLYECLTLERPHTATTTETLLRAIVSGDRRDPVRFNRALQRDLSLVLQTALETDAARRYPSALAFAEDLRRLRHNEPIAARPIGAALRLRRWTRRHPVFAVAIALLLAALAVTTVLVLQLMAQRRSLLAWQQVLESVTHGDPTIALGNAVAAAAHVPERKLNDPLLQVLGRSPTMLEFDAARLGSSPGGAFFTHDDRHLIVPTAGGELVVVAADTGAVVHRVSAHTPQLHSFNVGFNEPRTEVVTSSWEGKVRRFDTRTWQELPLAALMADANAHVHKVASPYQYSAHNAWFSPDGRYLALGGVHSLLVSHLESQRTWQVQRDTWMVQQAVFRPKHNQLVVRWREYRQEYGASVAQVFDLETGAPAATLDLEGQETFACAFDADGTRFASVGLDGVVRVFDAATWRYVHRLVGGGEDYRTMSWVEFFDADTVVSSGFEGLTVWDLRRGARIAQITASSLRPFHAGAFNRARTLLAVVVKDGTLRVYDTATWQEVARALWHYHFPDSITWNTAGERILFQDGREQRTSVRVIALQAPAPLLHPHRGALVDLEFLTNREVLTASHDGNAAIVDAATGIRRATFAHAASVRSARASADGARIVTACDDGLARIWTRGSGAAPLQLAGHTGPVHDALWFDGDRRVLTIGADGRACVFDAATAACRELGRHASACLSAAIDPALRLLATGGADRKVRVYDWDGNLLRELDTFFEARRPVYNIEGNAQALAFDAARRRLVVGHRSGVDLLIAFDVATWQPLRIAANPRRQGQAYSMHAALVPGGRFYATAHSGVGDWTFIDAQTLTPRDVGEANMPDSIVSVMRFSPADDALLLVGARDGRVTLWDLHAGERHLDVRGEHGGIRCAEFSADGQWVATGSQDGTLHVWPVHPLPLARAHYVRLTGK